MLQMAGTYWITQTDVVANNEHEEHSEGDGRCLTLNIHDIRVRLIESIQRDARAKKDDLNQEAVHQLDHFEAIRVTYTENAALEQLGL